MKAASVSSPRDSGEPFSRDAVKIEPAPDVLGRNAEVPGQIGHAPALDDRDTFHVTRRDTLRVAGQHDRGHELCDSGEMTPGERLRELRTAAGLTPEALAARVGMAASTVRAHENQQNGIKAKAASAYATALGVSPEEILFPGQRARTDVASKIVAEGVRRVPVLGVVQAGAWAEVIGHDPEPLEWVVFDEPEYARAKAFALLVRGPSTNKVYPDGCRIICIPAIEGGVREGDFVVVRRTRGGFVETTLKQLVIGKDGGVELWPRSDDPAFQEPYRIENARDADDGYEIVAVVVARYDVGRTGRGPLLDLG